MVLEKFLHITLLYQSSNQKYKCNSCGCTWTILCPCCKRITDMVTFYAVDYCKYINWDWALKVFLTTKTELVATQPLWLITVSCFQTTDWILKINETRLNLFLFSLQNGCHYSHLIIFIMPHPAIKPFYTHTEPIKSEYIVIHDVAIYTACNLCHMW